MVFVFAVSCLSSASAVENSDPNENIEELFLNSIPIESDVPGQYQFIAYHEPVQTRSASQQKAVTTFTIVPGNEEEAQLLDAITRSGGGSTYRYDWDSSGGVKAYVTVSYTDLGNKISLNRVSGGYEKHDHSLSIVSQVLTMGQPIMPISKMPIGILQALPGLMPRLPVGLQWITSKAFTNIWAAITELISSAAAVRGDLK